MEDFQALFEAAEELTKQAEEAYTLAIAGSPIKDLEKADAVLTRIKQVSSDLRTHKQRLITHLIGIVCGLEEDQRRFSGPNWSVWYAHNCTRSHLTWKDRSEGGVFIHNLALAHSDEIFWELAAAFFAIAKPHVEEQLATRPTKLNKEIAAFTSFVEQLRLKEVVSSAS
jgi:hypothetical protein